MRLARLSGESGGLAGGPDGTIWDMRPPLGDDYFAWVERLAVPHHHKEAFWHLVLSGPPALGAVRAGLAHDDASVRAGCARVLDHLVDDESWPDLLEVLDDADAGVRLNALHALACDRCKENGCTPTKATVLPHALERLRRDPTPIVRAIALEVVARWVHEDPDALDAIVAAQRDDPDPGVRKKAGWFVPGGVRYEKTKPKARARA
jgi:HEAT repeat protein